MLADIGNEQPGQSVNKHAGGDNGNKRDDPLRVKRVIGEVWLGDGLEVKLLPLGFYAGCLQRCEGRC